MIRIIAAVIAMVGLIGLVVSYSSTPAMFSQNADLVARLETARLLYRQVIVVPLGPLVITATPFHLVYFLLSIGLAFFALLVCLIRCFFYRYIYLLYLHLPARRQVAGFISANWLNH